MAKTLKSIDNRGRHRTRNLGRGEGGIFVFGTTAPPPVGQSLLIHEVSRSHTTTHHIRYDSSGRVISPSQRSLYDSTQHSQQTSMSPAGFEPTIPAGERPQTYPLDRVATGTDGGGVLETLIYERFNL